MRGGPGEAFQHILLRPAMDRDVDVDDGPRSFVDHHNARGLNGLRPRTDSRDLHLCADEVRLDPAQRLTSSGSVRAGALNKLLTQEFAGAFGHGIKWR